MEPQRGIGIALLFVVLTLVGAVVLVSNVGPATGDDAEATITVGANGVVTAPPDLAIVDLGVEASADTAEAARSAVAANVSRLRDALSDADVPDDRIRTTAFSIRTRSDENGTVTYEASHELELRLAVEDAGRIVDTAVQSGATRVDGVRFTLVENTRRQLRATALEDALENARSDAGVVADATALRVRSVTAVQTTDGEIGPVLSERAPSEPTTFEPGPVTVVASVTVTYAAD